MQMWQSGSPGAQEVWARPQVASSTSAALHGLGAAPRRQASMVGVCQTLDGME